MGRAALWHRRAAEWAGMSDERECVRNWRLVREFAASVTDAKECAALLGEPLPDDRRPRPHRTSGTRDRGVSVIRIWNNDVIENLDGFCNGFCRNSRSRHSPLPSPRKRGEGVELPAMILQFRWQGSGRTGIVAGNGGGTKSCPTTRTWVSGRGWRRSRKCLPNAEPSATRRCSGIASALHTLPLDGGGLGWGC
jgi:hypothetical protein